MIWVQTVCKGYQPSDKMRCKQGKIKNYKGYIECDQELKTKTIIILD